MVLSIKETHSSRKCVCLTHRSKFRGGNEASLMNQHRMTDTMSFEQLVDAGVYELDGWDDDGEMQFRLVPETAKVKAPEVYWQYQNDMQQKLLDAIDEGFIEWDFDPDTLEETLVFTEKCNDLN